MWDWVLEGDLVPVTSTYQRSQCMSNMWLRESSDQLKINYRNHGDFKKLFFGPLFLENPVCWLYTLLDANSKRIIFLFKSAKEQQQVLQTIEKISEKLNKLEEAVKKKLISKKDFLKNLRQEVGGLAWDFGLTLDFDWRLFEEEFKEKSLSLNT